MRELTGGRGVEFAFSAIAAPSGARAGDADVRLRRHGNARRHAAAGREARRSTSRRTSSTRGITIAVTHGGDTIPQEDFPFLAQAALDGRLDLARFVTSTISLDEVPEQLPRIGEGGGIRTVALL